MFNIRKVCAYTTLLMSLVTQASEKPFEFEPIVGNGHYEDEDEPFGFIGQEDAPSLLKELRQKQNAAREMFKDKPTAQQLAQKYTLEQLKKAERDVEAVRFHEGSRESDLCHDQVTYQWARAQYYDAMKKEQAARKQLEIIQEAIVHQQKKENAGGDSSDNNNVSGCTIL